MTPHRPAKDHAVTPSRRLGVVASGPQDVTVAPPWPGDVETPRPAQSGTGPASYTLRLSADEALDLDDLMTELRRDTGRRRLDKSTVLKALIQLVDADSHVRTALIGHLRAQGTAR